VHWKAESLKEKSSKWRTADAVPTKNCAFGPCKEWNSSRKALETEPREKSFILSGLDDVILVRGPSHERGKKGNPRIPETCPGNESVHTTLAEVL